MRLFLVGGAVRDMLLGRTPREHDFTFLGSEAEFRAAFPQARPAGKAFPIHLLQGMEFAPARGEDMRQDLERRDLTINALALEVPFPGQEHAANPPGLLLLHDQALRDLSTRVLRPASASAMRDDPARVFRAARFYAQLPDFTPHRELIQAMRQCARRGLLNDLPPERVAQELRKALDAPRPGNFLRLLDQAECLRHWFPELTGASRVPAGPPPYHDGDVLSHTVQVMDRLAGLELATWMGLAHDLGKTVTDPAIWPHHYEHEHRGEPMARNLGERLRLPTRFVNAGAAAAKLHMKAGRYLTLRPGTRVDLLDRLYRLDLVAEMFALARADSNENLPDPEPLAREDLARMLAVSLPKTSQNQGEASGKKLRGLRCQALADTPRIGIAPGGGFPPKKNRQQPKRKPS